MAAKNDIHAPLVCPHCRTALEATPDTLDCSQCRRKFPQSHGITDFSEGQYYDQEPGEAGLSAEQQAGLDHEISGTTARVEDFYGPLLDSEGARRARNAERPLRVLDSGCGNGLSIDLLNDRGIEAWGNDISALRKWQWQQRERRDRLVVADTRRLPFPDGYFDAVISSGVIEHIGVAETGGEHYTVEVLPERDDARIAFLGELLRVLAPGGTFFLDCPNGAFPIDFWHGPKAGNARFHSLREGFLPTAGEIRRYVGEIGQYTVRPMSPHGRLRMRQVGRHWYGQLFRIPMEALLQLMRLPPLRFLAASPLNPYLVLRIE